MTTNLLDDTGNQPDIDPTKNYLEELVGENKKFKTAEDLAKGKFMSDSYISTLERQRDEMREDYLKLREEAAASTRLQELLDKLEEKADLTSRELPLSNEEKSTGVNPEQVESLVSAQVLAMRESERQEENRRFVERMLNERLGSNYKSVLKEQAKALELTDDEVNLMAKNKPNLFLKTFGLDQPVKTESFQAPLRSQSRTDTFAPQTTKRTYSYYQNMRKTNPNLYLDRKIAIQMDKDAQALGKDFFDV